MSQACSLRRGRVFTRPRFFSGVAPILLVGIEKFRREGKIILLADSTKFPHFESHYSNLWRIRQLMKTNRLLSVILTAGLVLACNLPMLTGQGTSPSNE